MFIRFLRVSIRPIILIFIVSACRTGEPDPTDYSFLDQLRSNEEVNLNEVFPGASEVCLVPEYNFTAEFLLDHGHKVDPNYWVPELKTAIFLFKNGVHLEDRLLFATTDKTYINFPNFGCFNTSSSAARLFEKRGGYTNALYFEVKIFEKEGTQ